MSRASRAWLLASTVLLISTSCAESGGVASVAAELTASQRVTRSAVIRDTAAAEGLANGLLLAGIALAETGMAHCWSEATWACQGPSSSSCGGGPVIAGAADGPCSDRQGGLGMFQFDAGNFDDTLAREGDRVLTLEGNIQAAVDFVVSMVIRSTYVAGVDNREQALAWMNTVRVGGPGYHEWLQTVTHYYNGCVPGRCSVYESRYAHYDDAHRQILGETGDAFWYDGVVVPVCEPIGPGGGVIEETGRCFTAGGDPRWWNRESSGHAGGLIWTNTTDEPLEDNHCIWRMTFTAAGRYELEVYTAAAFSQSARAAYQVSAAGGTTPVVLDQGATDGFASLGEHRFEAGIEYTVHLSDNTGEPYATATKISCDALRVTAIGTVAPAPDAGTAPTEDAGSTPPLGDAGVPPVEGDGGSAGSPSLAAGCSVGGRGPSLAPTSRGLPMLLALFACALRRRR